MEGESTTGRHARLKSRLSTPQRAALNSRCCLTPLPRAPKPFSCLMGCNRARVSEAFPAPPFCPQKK